MREIGACLYRDNEERIDPDRDFSHIDKRIQDVLGQYQKDFMGEVSADNLGARWGGYGSFLPVTRCSSVPIITRPSPHLSSRSPHNSTSEVRQSPTIQANESTNVRPRPGIPSSGQSTLKLENAVDVLKNEQKSVPVDLSDNSVSKMIADNVVDNSAIYSGLGLDISPSSSFEDSPLDINGTPSCSQGLPENSPSYIIKVMTSLPVTGGKLMSPLSERFVSLTKKEIKQDRNLPRVETSLKTEQELVSSEIVLIKERKLKPGTPSKMKDSNISKGKEIITENPVDTSIIHLDKKKDHISRSYPFNQRNGAEKVDSLASTVSTDFIHSDKKGTSTFKEKGNSSRASYPISKKNGAAKLVVDKQSHVKEEPPSEQVNSFEEKEIPAGFSDKIQRDMKATTVIKNGNVNQNSKKFSEPKSKVKEELPEPFSSQDHKQQQKMKIHNDRKPNPMMEKDLDDKKQIKNEELLEGKKVKKEKLSSSESKKKIRKSRESLVLPKLSFKVGSSAAAAFSQQTDCGSDEVRKVNDKSSDVTSNATPKKKEKMTASKDPIVGVGKREKHAIGIQVKDNKPDSSPFQYPKAEDPIGNNNVYSMEKVPTETAPVVIEEDWVQCDKCEAWRLLPPNIKPSHLPPRWHCSMLTWLPGMNKCSFTEAETTNALHALYQLPPAAVNNAQIPQNKEPPLLVAAIDPVADPLKRGSKRVEITTDMVESAKKHKPIQLRSGPGKQVVVVGKKREGSIDTHGALKKVKRDSQQFAKDRNSTVPLAMEIGNATLNDDDSSQVPKDLVNRSKKHKEKAQRTVTKEDERKDMSARKRKSRDPTEIVPSSGAPSNDIRREKRQKLELNLKEKEHSTTKPNDKNDGGEQGNSQKTGRREDRNTSRKTVDGKKLSRPDKELKMPALTAATSSSSKISSTCRVKMKSQQKSSPVGSISSSPMRVSRSNHDRNRDQKHELSVTKNKNLEVTDANKQIGIKLKDKSVDVLGLDKIISDNLLPERFRSEQDQAGSSTIRDHPFSSTQVLDFSKIVGLNATSSHDDIKKKLPSQQGCGKLIGDEARASTSAVRKDNSDRAARAALKEAKDLKHSANRLKISGSGLSTEVFFQAALKFLNGASLLEFDNTEGSGSSDMKPSDVYRSTAKLCFYCAREFEKQNDMASAALAYKCMEVAYMRVVYYSDVVASRDRHELQLAQTEVPQVVESPSSSASDVDNVNNPTSNGVVVKPTQSSANHGNYVIAAANRPSFDRILNFAEDVNLAMDAARKSQNAFTAARSTLTEAGNEDGITAIKRVLDFSFHDVGELLYLVRLAMEAIPNC